MEPTTLRMFDEKRTLRPVTYPWTKNFTKAMHHNPWTVDKFNFTSDLQDYHVHMSEQKKQLTVRSLSLIGQVELEVKTFWGKLGDNLPHPSFRDLGYVYANTEVVHSDAYARLVEVLGMEDIFEENLKLSHVRGRVNYLKKHTHKYHADNHKQFIYALILFTLFVENISLFSQFYAIKWLSRFDNILKSVDQQISYTCREEDLHAKAGIQIINTARVEYPELFDEALEIKVMEEAADAFKYEEAILEWMLAGINEPGLNLEVLRNFLKNRFNQSLVAIGYKPLFTDIDQERLKQTLWFDEEMLANIDTDFFHQTPVEYSKNNQSITAADLF